MSNSTLGNVSLVEQVFQSIYDTRGNVAQPNVLLLARGSEPLETCDAVQRALRGENGEAYAIGGHLQIDPNSGAIVRFQWTTVAIGRPCEPRADVEALQACNADFPRCTEYRRCARYFDGTRQGLRDALQHVIAQFDDTAESDSGAGTTLVGAALIATERITASGPSAAVAQSSNQINVAATEGANGARENDQLALQCRDVLASVRDVTQALKRDRLVASSATTAEERQTAASANDSAAGASKCGACASKVLASSLAREAIAKQRIAQERSLRRKCEQYAVLALAMILLVVTVLAIVLAVRSGQAHAAHKAAEQKLDALMIEALQQRGGK